MACGRRGERGLYITLTETRNDLERACRSHGWSSDAIAVSDLTQSQFNVNGESQYIVFHPSEVELGETTRQILAEVERIEPEHVVFDGLSELRLLAADPLRYRRQLLSLKHYFEEHGMTVLLLDDRTSPMGQIQPESLVGGNIVMEKYLPGYGGARRRLFVTKVRGADFRDGYHDYEIAAEGVVVHPRLVAAEHHEEFEAEVLSSGVANLDAMLDGGLQTGSTTLLLGPAGVGKSTVAMQFVARALQQGRRAAVFTFDEVLSTLFARSEKLVCNGIQRYYEGGQLYAQQVNPAELSPGGFADKVTRVVEARGAGGRDRQPQRLPVRHAGRTVPHDTSPRDVRLPQPARSRHDRRRGPARPAHGQRGRARHQLPRRHGPAPALLRGGGADPPGDQRLQEADRAHERTLRELLITGKGVQVGEPLRGFRGILTGVPQYEGQTRLLHGGEGRDA